MLAMSALTFRSRTGDLVEPASFSATEVKNEIGKVLDAVSSRGIATITRHERPRAVILSMEEFEALVQSRQDSLGELSRQFDEIFSRMQEPGAAKAARAALFDTPEKEIGRVAVKAAARRRRR